MDNPPPGDKCSPGGIFRKRSVMRKFLLLIIFSFTALQLFSRSITPQEAELVATRFFYGAGTKSSSRLLKRVRPDNSSPDSDAQPLYFFNKPDFTGFAIVSGSSLFQPVLAYSNDAPIDLDNMPPNLEEWVSQMAACIIELEGQKHDGRSEHPNWAALKPSAVENEAPSPVILYETASWNQNYPYNADCPMVGVKRCWAGCSATAMAIIMRYYMHPLYGSGFTDAYSYVNEKGSVVKMNSESLSGRFNWADMPLKNTYSWTDENKGEVSHLIYLCALMCHVEFRTDASPGSLYDGLLFLQKKLGYDKSSLFHVRAWYTDEQWLDLICKNLRTSGPLLYSASSEQSGHAFVVDGYDSQMRFHVNWGWGGLDNGYFSFPGFLSYRYDHRAAIGLRPDQGGSPVQYLSLNASYGCQGITLEDTEEVKENSAFTINCGFLQIESVGTAFRGYVKAVLIDGKDDVKESVSDESRIELDSGTGYREYRLRCLVTKEIASGDRIKLYHKNDREGVWRPVLFDRSGVVGELPICDRYSIEEATSLKFNPIDGCLTFTTKQGVRYRLISCGVSYAEGISEEGVPVVVDTSLIPGGTYSLVLEKKKESVRLSLEL